MFQDGWDADEQSSGWLDGQANISQFRIFGRSTLWVLSTMVIWISWEKGGFLVLLVVGSRRHGLFIDPAPEDEL